MLKKKDILTILFINAFFLAICLLFGKLQYGSLDDFFMAGVLTGIHGNSYNPHLYFVNALYGYALLPLYHLFPKIGWYYIGEMFGSFCSLTLISLIIVKKTGRWWGTLLASIFVAGFCSDVYLVTQFTHCGALFSAAGMLSVLFGVLEEKKHFCIAGAVLVLWGSMMRWQAFEMGVPFAALLVLFLYKDLWLRKKAFAFWLSVICLLVGACHFIDKHLYLTEDYKTFSAIQGPRSALGDGSNYNMQAVYEDLEEIGKSGKDYAMLTQWVFYDTEHFKTDSLREILKYVEQYRNVPSPQRVLSGSLDVLNGFFDYPSGQVFLIFCVFAFVSKKGRYAWLSLIIFLALTSYLLYLNRLVYRVEMGLLLYATVFTIPLLKQLRGFSPKLLYTILFLFAFVNILIYSETGACVRNPQNGVNEPLVSSSDTTNYDLVFKYINENPSKMFLVSMGTYMNLARHKNPPYVATPKGEFKRIVSFGYWTPYLPEITGSLKEFGIVNPIKDVVHDNVVVIGENGLNDYLQRHYYDSVQVQVLHEIDDVVFYKYSVVEK